MLAFSDYRCRRDRKRSILFFNLFTKLDMIYFINKSLHHHKHLENGHTCYFNIITVFNSYLANQPFEEKLSLEHIQMIIKHKQLFIKYILNVCKCISKKATFNSNKKTTKLTSIFRKWKKSYNEEMQILERGNNYQKNIWLECYRSINT